MKNRNDLIADMKRRYRPGTYYVFRMKDGHWYTCSTPPEQPESDVYEVTVKSAAINRIADVICRKI